MASHRCFPIEFKIRCCVRAPGRRWFRMKHQLGDDQSRRVHHKVAAAGLDHGLEWRAAGQRWLDYASGRRSEHSRRPDRSGGVGQGRARPGLSAGRAVEGVRLRVGEPGNQA